MGNYRLSKDTKERYTSLEEMRAAWGLPPVVKRTRDENKLQKQREKFVNKYLCEACGNPMTYVAGTDVMTCTNEKCKGIEIKRLDKEGNEKKYYVTSYKLLNETGADIASNIFD